MGTKSSKTVQGQPKKKSNSRSNPENNDASMTPKKFTTEELKEVASGTLLSLLPFDLLLEIQQFLLWRPPCRAKVLYEYEANDKDELSLKQGDILIIEEKDPSGWWKAVKGDQRGWIPENYVELLP